MLHRRQDAAGHHVAVDAVAERPPAPGGHAHGAPRHYLLPHLAGQQLGQRVHQVAQGAIPAIACALPCQQQIAGPAVKVPWRDGTLNMVLVAPYLSLHCHILNLQSWRLSGDHPD